ncbi:hypothetical protein BSLG_000987 [Batrachochytrium salamandrivorans]|nr:hypothetical protein BSLG_000987 [Batrachochytrium salamandrivorans]
MSDLTLSTQSVIPTFSLEHPSPVTHSPITPQKDPSQTLVDDASNSKSPYIPQKMLIARSGSNSSLGSLVSSHSGTSYVPSAPSSPSLHTRSSLATCTISQEEIDAYQSVEPNYASAETRQHMFHIANTATNAGAVPISVGSVGSPSTPGFPLDISSSPVHAFLASIPTVQVPSQWNTPLVNSGHSGSLQRGVTSSPAMQMGFSEPSYGISPDSLTLTKKSIEEPLRGLSGSGQSTPIHSIHSGKESDLHAFIGSPLSRRHSSVRRGGRLSTRVRTTVSNQVLPTLPRPVNPSLQDATTGVLLSSFPSIAALLRHRAHTMSGLMTPSVMLSDARGKDVESVPLIDSGVVAVPIVTSSVNSDEELTELEFIIESSSIDMCLTTDANVRTLTKLYTQRGKTIPCLEWLKTNELGTFSVPRESASTERQRSIGEGSHTDIPDSPTWMRNLNEISSDEIAYIEYVKNSYGEYKGVAVHHGMIMAQCAALMTAYNLNSKDVIGVCLEPRQHVGLLFFGLAGVYSGCSTLLMPEASMAIAGVWPKCLEKKKVSVFATDMACTYNLIASSKAISGSLDISISNLSALKKYFGGSIVAMDGINHAPFMEHTLRLSSIRGHQFEFVDSNSGQSIKDTIRVCDSGRRLWMLPKLTEHVLQGNPFLFVSPGEVLPASLGVKPVKVQSVIEPGISQGLVESVISRNHIRTGLYGFLITQKQSHLMEAKSVASIKGSIKRSPGTLSGDIQDYSKEYGFHLASQLTNSIALYVPGAGAIVFFDILLNGEFLPVVLVESYREDLSHMSVQIHQVLRDLHDLHVFCVSICCPGSLPRMYADITTGSGFQTSFVGFDAPGILRVPTGTHSGVAIDFAGGNSMCLQKAINIDVESSRKLFHSGALKPLFVYFNGSPRVFGDILQHQPSFSPSSLTPNTNTLQIVGAMKDAPILDI